MVASLAGSTKPATLVPGGGIFTICPFYTRIIKIFLETTFEYFLDKNTLFKL